MKKIDANYPPLLLLKDVSKKYPLAWKQMEMFHKANGEEGLGSWPDWCYAPMAASIAVVNSNDGSTGFPDISYVQAISALAPWRQSKEVFAIEKGLESALYEQNNFTDIPAEILLRLPYRSFYVDCNALSIGDEKKIPIDGFFTHLEYDAKTGEKELRFLALYGQGETFGRFIHLGEKTLKESFDRANQISIGNLCNSDLGLGNISESIFTSITDTYSDAIMQLERDMLQIVLYICAENADIEKDLRYKEKRFGRVRDRANEIRVWGVGRNVGESLKGCAPVGSKTGSKKTPHLRHGHWHHFWTGKRNEESSRRLVLRWVSPVVVNAGEATLSVHIVDGDSNN